MGKAEMAEAPVMEKEMFLSLRKILVLFVSNRHMGRAFSASMCGLRVLHMFGRSGCASKSNREIGASINRALESRLRSFVKLHPEQRSITSKLGDSIVKTVECTAVLRGKETLRRIGNPVSRNGDVDFTAVNAAQCPGDTSATLDVESSASCEDASNVGETQLNEVALVW